MNIELTKLADDAAEMLIETAALDPVFLNATSFRYLMTMLGEEVIEMAKVDPVNTQGYEGMAKIVSMVLVTLQTYCDRVALQDITDISDIGEAL